MENNNVDHPQHYTNCSLECIDVMKLVFGQHQVAVFCTVNAFKYMWRYKHKNGEEDLAKARWYLKEAEKIESTEKIENTPTLDLLALLEKLEGDNNEG